MNIKLKDAVLLGLWIFGESRVCADDVPKPNDPVAESSLLIKLHSRKLMRGCASSSVCMLDFRCLEDGSQTSLAEKLTTDCKKKLIYVTSIEAKIPDGAGASPKTLKKRVNREGDIIPYQGVLNLLKAYNTKESEPTKCAIIDYCNTYEEQSPSTVDVSFENAECERLKAHKNSACTKPATTGESR